MSEQRVVGSIRESVATGRKGALLLVIACAQSLLVAACIAVPGREPTNEGPTNGAPTNEAPAVAFKDRRMSEFTPDFADKPYDLKCGECSYEHAIDVCKNLGRSSAVLRASVVSESPPATRCDVINAHNWAYRCSSDIEVTLQDVQVLRGSFEAKDATKLRARFTYMIHGESPRARFLSQDSPYFLFIYPNQDRQHIDTAWMALAVCPVVESN